MAINPYSPCPCGSGKKLKFCCNDLAPEIEKVHRWVSGDQPHAALKHVEALLVKQPERASLLELAATLELTLEEFDKAREVIDRYVAAHPKSPSALAQKAILLACTESGTKAVDALQDSLELLDEDMPLRVLEAIGAVGHALLSEGEIVAGRGHLLLYAAIAPEGNDQAIDLLLRMNLQAGLPLLLREHLLARSCPPDAPWEPEFAHADRAIARGQWRAAEAILMSLREKAGPEPDIVYNLALVQAWLGKTKEFAQGLHEYARLDVPEMEAVEAEAIAQLVDPELKDPQVDTVCMAYRVADEDELLEQLISDKRVDNQPVDQEKYEDAAECPRSSYVLLSKPMSSVGPDLNREEIPRVMAFLSLFGKRTDRDAQLVLTTDRNDQFEQTQSLLQEVTDGTLGELVDEEVLISRSVAQDALSWRWRLPTGVPIEQRLNLIAEERRLAILERWVRAPRAVLGNKAPLEVAENPDLRLPLMGCVFVLEQAAEDPSELAIFDELRELLGLPPVTQLENDAVDQPGFTAVRVPRLELGQLTDDQLQRLFDHAMMTGASVALMLVCRELIARAEDDPQRDVRNAFRQLIRAEAVPERVFGTIDQARRWARNRKSSEAEWVLAELEVALQTGNAEVAQRALGEIHSTYAQEEGVAEAVYRMLYQAGLLDPNRKMQMGEAPGGPVAGERGPAAPAAGEKKIWTPDGETSAEEVAAEGGKKVLWTP